MGRGDVPISMPGPQDLLHHRLHAFSLPSSPDSVRKTVENFEMIENERIDRLKRVGSFSNFMVQSSLSLNPTPVSKKENSIVLWGRCLLKRLASYPNVFQFCSSSIIGTSQD